MVARRSAESWDEAGGVAAQALALQARVAPLALADARVWEEALMELDSATGGGQVSGVLEAKLELAAAVPLQIAEAAADTAALAALAADRGVGSHRADAVAAAVLAAAGARAATHLVEVNLAIREGDAQLVSARANASAAADAATRALEVAR
jgi:formiminotetrahydrofolate cyclodeaminase